MSEHNKLGKKGEDSAAAYLAGLGYKIIDRNWRHQKDEIDIIARDGDFLVIVEVKTRSTDVFGNPEDAVTNKKQKFLIRAAEEYIFKNDIQLETRYDIVSIVKQGNKEIIKHIKEAFYPTL
jgi:putative endonuclease